MSYPHSPECCGPHGPEIVCRLLEEALADEMHDRLTYEKLMEQMPTPDQCEIVRSIRDDEIKHFHMFQLLYQELCQRPPHCLPKPETSCQPCLCEAIQQAILGELGAVETYRRILFLLCNQRQRDMLLEIITDEMKHAIKWNLLYTRNCCSACYRENSSSST